MSSTKTTQESSFKSLFAAIVIPVALVVSWIIFKFILGSEGNFDAEHHPINVLGIVHEGGIIVPILITVLLLVLTFSIERFITIAKAKGNGSVEPFIRNVKSLMSADKFDAAIA